MYHNIISQPINSSKLDIRPCGHFLVFVSSSETHGNKVLIFVNANKKLLIIRCHSLCYHPKISDIAETDR